MSNAGKSIFSCQRDLDRFLRMYIDERRTHGARASQPSASASPLLATPTLPLISQDDLFAKSRQALLGTDDGVSRPAKTKAIEAADAPDLVSPESKRLRSETPASSAGAAQPAESERGLLPMPTERSLGDANWWAAAWVEGQPICAAGTHLHTTTARRTGFGFILRVRGSWAQLRRPSCT